MAIEDSDTTSQYHWGPDSLGIPPPWSTAGLPALLPGTAQGSHPHPNPFQGEHLHQAVRAEAHENPVPRVPSLAGRGKVLISKMTSLWQRHCTPKDTHTRFLHNPIHYSEIRTAGPKELAKDASRGRWPVLDPSLQTMNVRVATQQPAKPMQDAL